MPQKEPFKISVPDATLNDLRERSGRTRWLTRLRQCELGIRHQPRIPEGIRRVLAHQYDWRRHEREMNSFANYKTEIDGIPIHFIHEPGKGPKPIPLILSHGWPWTFWDFHKVIRPLTDPAAFGGDPADAFDVVVPSLPGYGFSTPLTTTGINYWRTADLWVKLMQDVLGYEKFAAQGGDWGAIITAQLGHKYADRLIGIHMNLLVSLGFFSGGRAQRPRTSVRARRAGSSATATSCANESGYMRLQCTKPQTVAVALNDSPAGLCSWILEKRRTWSDCGGDVERRFTKDDLCTTMMLYWMTAELRHLGALLLRGGAQSLEALARPQAGGRGADRRRGLPQGSHADAAEMGGALLQSEALDRDAVGRPLRADGRA